MAVLARHAAAHDAAMRSAELAEATGVPRSYLSKVCRRLTEAGLLVSQKGHRGGFRLAKPADAISFESILKAVDALPSQGMCAFGWGACDAQNPCPLHDKWSELLSRFDDWATRSFVAELTE